MKTESHVNAQVIRRFAASAERVFDAWLQPDMASQWLFTSPEAREMAGRRFEIDARVGGCYTIVNRMHGQEIMGTGEYLELDQPRRLVFTFKIPQFSDSVDRVIVAIAPLEHGCQLTLTQEITVPHDDTLAPQETRCSMPLRRY
jgi:uncharacterized protein YndB with AHSA1/START domain